MDEIIRAISGDGFVSAAVVSSRELTERARVIHGASPVVTAALGRTMSATSIIGSALKKDGASVTVRINGGGDVGTIIVVSDPDGNVRAYAQNPKANIPNKASGKLDVGGIVGSKGMRTVIRDFGSGEPYVGSVELVSGEIAEDFTSYFTVSEQTPCACGLGVLVGGDGAVIAAGGYVVTLLPGAPETLADIIEQNVADTGAVSAVLSGADAETMLHKITRGLDCRVIERKPIEYRCYCSREKVAAALYSLSEDEKRDITKTGEPIEVTCQFCDAVYVFDGIEVRD
jgi:molecular chaperone Hsp33